MTEQNVSKPRIFKIGAVRIVEDESMRGQTPDAIRAILKASYPEVAHATMRETTLEDGTVFIEYLPQPGRKG
ncbi:MAG TPA: hypothetical protein PKX07_18695 [Aggregatilineales bacterium]|nr:hypothetical protein [Aggregatilineales bacterium]